MPFTPVSASDPVAPLENILNTRFAELDNSIAASTANRQILSYKWANAGARAAQTGMSLGDYGFQQDTLVTYYYTGTVWRAWDSDWIVVASPTTSGITFGSGGAALLSYRYCLGDIETKFKVTLGAGGSWTSPSISMPFAANMTHLSTFSQIGDGSVQNGSSFWPMTANVAAGGGSMTLYVSTGSPVVFASITASVPVAVAAGLNLSGRALYTPV